MDRHETAMLTYANKIRKDERDTIIGEMSRLKAANKELVDKNDHMQEKCRLLKNQVNHFKNKINQLKKQIQ